MQDDIAPWLKPAQGEGTTRPVFYQDVSHSRRRLNKRRRQLSATGLWLVVPEAVPLRPLDLTVRCAMKIGDAMPDLQTLLELEAAELAGVIIRQLCGMRDSERRSLLHLGQFTGLYTGNSHDVKYPQERWDEINHRLAEAWEWLIANGWKPLSACLPAYWQTSRSVDHIAGHTRRRPSDCIQSNQTLYSSKRP